MSWGKIVIFAAEIPQGLLEWKPCGTEAAGPATPASSWTWLLEVLISNSSGEWNYTLCFFHSWLSSSVCISSGERRTQTPTEMCSLTVALDPCPMGRVSIFLVPGARGRRVRSQETREECVGRPDVPGQAAAPGVCRQLPWRLGLQSPQGSHTASGRPVGTEPQTGQM